MDDPGIEVFICSASEDYPHAGEVFRYLSDAGIRCFFSDPSLDSIGQAEYKRVIDRALEQCRHLVVVASTGVNAEKEWVRYEWDTYVIERLDKRKNGNLITLACAGLAPAALPLTLRQNQILKWPKETVRLLSYVGHKGTPAPVVPAIEKRRQAGSSASRPKRGFFRAMFDFLDPNSPGNFTEYLHNRIEESHKRPKRVCAVCKHECEDVWIYCHNCGEKLGPS
jgi:hypothetical protein